MYRDYTDFTQDMMKIPIAKEGMQYGIIPLISGIIFLFAKLWVIAVLFIFIGISAFLFFRQPNRIVNENAGLIYAPADGRVVHISDEYENIFFKDIAHRISIFMSIFNVHINYAPINGVVECIKYTPGRFKKADIIALNESNENNFIGLSNDFVKVGVRQVAGWIARRIVCNCRIGDKLTTGERLGLIKFGSRVDVYFPKDYNICVKLNECVRAGRTVLGEKR